MHVTKFFVEENPLDCVKLSRIMAFTNLYPVWPYKGISLIIFKDLALQQQQSAV